MALWCFWRSMKRYIRGRVERLLRLFFRLSTPSFRQSLNARTPLSMSRPLARAPGCPLRTCVEHTLLPQVRLATCEVWRPQGWDVFTRRTYIECATSSALKFTSVTTECARGQVRRHLLVRQRRPARRAAGHARRRHHRARVGRAGGAGLERARRRPWTQARAAGRMHPVRV